MDYETLFERVKAIHDSIPTDGMGGSPLEKCFLMAYLAQRLELKTLVEIGVYRGKSLFSVAPAFIHNGGRCYGIDPWLSENLREKELSDEVKKLVDDFADTTDFDALYHEVLERSQELDMDRSVTLLRKTSEEAYDYFAEHLFSRGVEVAPEREPDGGNDAFIDMLHIDGNHDYEYVDKDARTYIPHVRRGGIIVFDDIGWAGVRRVYDRVKENCVVLYEDDGFAVLYQDEELAREMRNTGFPMPSWAEIRLLQKSLPTLIENVRFSQNYDSEKRRLRVLVGIMTYNSADYIEECIQSILVQQGDFDIKIGVFDDASTDDTVERVRGFRDLPEHIHITVYPKEVNEGYEKNYIRIFEALEKSDADFLTCIDGDDYLLSPLRFMRNVNELLRRPECALSFNRFLYYYQDKNALDLWSYQDSLTKDTYTAMELAEEYFIGNGSCSTVRRNAATGLSDELFLQAKIGDWLTHCMYATKGDIAYIREPMNVYRKHNQGVWSGVAECRRGAMLIRTMAAFNGLTAYLFYEKLYKKQAEISQCEGMEDTALYNLTIIDDVFPHPSSGFRFEEFGAYLAYFENMQIWCNGASTMALGKRRHPDIMAEYKQAQPGFANMMIEAKHPYELAIDRKLRSRLAYFCFLGNAFTSLDVVERDEIPFVFELYPGGSFQLDSAKSDAMLERVLHSPCFRKVIVTQDVTRDYLLRTGLCVEEQIVSIFGVVTPERALKTVPRITDGGDDSVLRVCFAAMRYTPTGVDKGYDVFLDAARQLAGRYTNIEFHVAGTFDEAVIPLGELCGRVKFHGVLNSDALGEFLRDMDIIVSPNLNNCISRGAFDGFPTATCTEAGLNGALILCTDPLHLNNGRFQNGEEIEIVEHNATAVAERLKYYYHNRDALREVIRRQGDRIRQLYAKDIQVGGRIRVLQQEIDRYPENLRELQRKKRLMGKPVKGYLYYSSQPDHFELENIVEFTLWVNKAGHFTGKLPLGDLNPEQAYIWLYFLNHEPSTMRFEPIRYHRRTVRIREHNAVSVINGVYRFDEDTPMLYLGYVEGGDQNERYLMLSGEIQTGLNEGAEIVPAGKTLCTGAILHADAVECVGDFEPISFQYLLEPDGSFSFDVKLSECPKEHVHLWLYFLANHACSCRFHHVTLNGQELAVTNSNGKRRWGKYIFDSKEPFLYFGGVPMVDEAAVLSVSGTMNLDRP